MAILVLKVEMKEGKAGYYSLHLYFPDGGEKEYADLTRDKQILRLLQEEISVGNVDPEQIPDILEDLLP